MQLENTEIIGDIPARYLNQAANLVNTPVGSLVLDRDFGIDYSFLDKTNPVAKQLYRAEVVRKIKKYLPAFKVDKIDFKEFETLTTDNMNILMPVITISVK